MSRNILMFGLKCFAATAHANICRVTTAGIAANDGASWSFPQTLQVALADPDCTEIWVSGGVYKPGNARTDTFKQDGPVAVYGGFAGNENGRNARDPAVNATILSGDIDNNDTNTDGNQIDESSDDIQGSNSYHVIYMDATQATPISANTLLDGFTITGGSADGVTGLQNDGGGLLCHAEVDGDWCGPSLSNINFSGNSATGSGGALCSIAGRGVTNPRLSNVSFSGNSACRGGAIASFSGEFSQNGFGTSSPVLSNVTFSGNSASVGGAMYSSGAYGGIADATLSNVTFSGNSATGSGSAIYHISSYGDLFHPTTGSLALHNAIVWGNMVPVGGSEIYSQHTFTSIDHSVVQGSGGSVNRDGSLGHDGGGNLDADPFLGALGKHGGSTATMLLGADSSAIDSGDDAVCAGTPVNGFDQRGIARPQGEGCDIGAVEMQVITDYIFTDGFEAIP